MILVGVRQISAFCEAWNVVIFIKSQNILRAYPKACVVIPNYSVLFQNNEGYQPII
jgi:hypothetical protein